MSYSALAAGRAVCFTLALLVSASSVLADDLEHSLNQAYQGKVFLVRNFWEGDHLRYDSAGQLMGNASIGYWTTDGLVRVDKAGISGDSVHLECKRLLIAAHGSNVLDYEDSRKRGNKLRIEVRLDPQRLTREATVSVFSKVFLAEQGSFLDSVPDYWKPCVRASLVGGGELQGTKCTFSDRLAALVRTTTTSEVSTESPKNAELASDRPEKVGGRVTAPHVIYAPDPDYSEEARQERLQGVTVLSLIVDGSGSPKNIHITRPLGYGLDEKAVAAVETWKFEPARKDGQPVSVAILVQVYFHLR